MLENLNPNEAVLSLKLGSISSWLILKKSNEEIYLKLDATMDQIRFSLTNLNNSLKDFDTKNCHLILNHHIFFTKNYFNLEEHLDGIDTIYTLYSDTGNIPLTQ